MAGPIDWAYQERMSFLRLIANESRQKDPAAAVAAITEYNRMEEAAARQPDLLRKSGRDEAEPPLPNVFTPETLAKRWGCSHRHVRNLINNGKLKCFRLGGKLVRIKTTDVLDYELRRSQDFDEEAEDPGEAQPKKRASRLDVFTRAQLDRLRKQGKSDV